MNDLTHLASRETWSLIDLMLRAALLGAAVLSISVLLRAASAGARHALWSMHGVALLLLPLLMFCLPAWRVIPTEPAVVAISQQRSDVSSPPERADAFPAPAAASAQKPPAAVPASSPSTFSRTATPASDSTHPVVAKLVSRPSLDWRGTIVLAWVTVAAALLLNVLRSWLGLLLLHRRFRQPTDANLNARLDQIRQNAGVRRRIRVLIGNDDAMPMTWGSLRPRLLLPAIWEEWPAEELDAVLVHEVAHVARWDYLHLLLARLMRALYWPVPFAWIAVNRLVREQERACDDRVLLAGNRPSAYAEQLLSLAERLRGVDGRGVTIVRRPLLDTRIRAVLDGQMNRSIPSRLQRALAALLAIGCLIPLARVQAEEIVNTDPIRIVALAAPDRSTSAEYYASLPFPPITEVDQDLPARPPKRPFDNAKYTIGPDGGPVMRKAEACVRIVDKQGKPMRIDEFRGIVIYALEDPKSPWQVGADRPGILKRYADAWCDVDDQWFLWGQRPGVPTEITAFSGGQLIVARGKTADPFDGEVEFVYDGPTQAEGGVDLSTGPAEVAIDELAGRVVDAVGKPVGGATVSFPRHVPPQFSWEPFYRPAVVTDADGVFRIKEFSKQWYHYCQIEAEGFASRRLADLPVGRPFQVALDSRTRLSGQLLGADGKPASGAKIVLVWSRQSARLRVANPVEIRADVDCDGEGRYDTLIEPGRYNVQIQAESGVASHPDFVITPGATSALPAQLNSGSTLTLQAVDSRTGKPVQGVRFYIVEPRPGYILPMKGSERNSDADGIVKWERLPGTKQEIHVWGHDAGYAQWWIKDAPRESWEVEMGGSYNALYVDMKTNDETLTVNMVPGARVKGVVLAPDGSPVANATVDIAGLMTGDARYSKKTDAQGRFDLIFAIVTRPANYAIVAFDQSGQWANGVSEKFLATPGMDHEVVIKLNSGGRVMGRVQTSAGAPVAGIEVEAYADDRMDRQYYSPRQITDAEGRFDLGPMRPATYRLVPDTRFGVNMAINPYDIKEQIEVREGETLNNVTIIYDGPPPPPVPERYFEYSSRRLADSPVYGKAPTTQSTGG